MGAAARPGPGGAPGAPRERTLLRHTYALPHEAQILITFAVALIIQEAVILLFSPLGQNVPVPALERHRVPGPYVYPAYRLAVVGVAAVIAVVLWLVIERTGSGRSCGRGPRAPRW